MSIDPTLLAAISADYTAFGAVLIDLNSGGQIALLDAAGTVAFSVDGSPVSFTGSDPFYGSLISIGAVTAGMTDEAPHVSVVIAAASTEGLGGLANPSQQGSRIRIYKGAVNSQTGAVIGTPLMTFRGFIDVPRVTGPTPNLSIELDCAASAARLSNPQEGRKLTLAWQQRCFPGSRGLEFNIQAQDDPPWGVEGVRSGFASTGSATSSGGGGAWPTTRDPPPRVR